MNATDRQVTERRERKRERVLRKPTPLEVEIARLKHDPQFQLESLRLNLGEVLTVAIKKRFRSKPFEQAELVGQRWTDALQVTDGLAAVPPGTTKKILGGRPIGLGRIIRVMTALQFRLGLNPVPFEESDR